MTATTDRPPADRSPQRRSPLADEHATPTRRQRRRRKAQVTRAFWGPTGQEPAVTARPIRPTDDPAAIPRSLGDPPLASELAPQQQLAVVYEEAVRAAVALAAANDLLDHTAGDDDVPGDPTVGLSTEGLVESNSTDRATTRAWLS